MKTHPKIKGIEEVTGLKILWTIDLTIEKEGERGEPYPATLSVCPLCQRVGRVTKNDGTFHVVSLLSNGSIWVSDRCEGNLENNIWHISEPAKSLTGRTKHPWELEK